MNPIAVIDRGRGPELAGTRITVFDVLPYFEEGWIDASIALWFGLSSAQVAALRKYFGDHEDEVLAENREILARIAQGNPPEIEARRAVSRAKLQSLMEELRRRRQEPTNGEGNPR